MSELWELGGHPAQAEVEDAGSRPRCPHCDRVMSNREATEQGACNDCSGGAYDPRDGDGS
jgi:hypothetical protein